VTKREFLEELRRRLSDLNDADFVSSVAYYEEMIDDRMEDGLSEEEAVEAIGTPADAAAQILEEMPLGKLIKARVKPKNKLPVWAIVLLIVGSPIWLSLLIAALAVVISVYAALWSSVASLWAAELSVALGAFASLVHAPILFATGFVWTGLAAIGSSLFMAGFSIFLFFGCLYATKGMCILAKQIFLLIKRAFVRKEAVQ